LRQTRAAEHASNGLLEIIPSPTVEAPARCFDRKSILQIENVRRVFRICNTVPLAPEY